MAPRIGHVFKPIRDRIDEKSIAEPNSGCLIWLGTINPEGYGKIRHEGRMDYAHRVSFELAYGKIPEGMHLDHLCRNTYCINPDHLEPVTNQENVKRGRVSALRPQQSFCCRGHALNENGYVDTQGHRQCRECLHIRQKEYYQRRKMRHVQR